MSAVTERSTVQFGRSTIAFEVRRSTRRKTVALAVEPGGAITLTDPVHVPLPRLHDLVRSKAPWVLERVKRQSDRPPPAIERELTSGASVLYLGRHYRLKLIQTSTPAVTLRGGWLVVTGERDDPERVRAAVTGWLRGRARVYLPRRLEIVCKRHHVGTPELVVTEQKGRWGSCTATGTLRINWRIVQAPLSLIDYVLLHELTHLTHPTHGTAFWAALGRRLPDYEPRRERLRQLGADLVW